MFSFETSRLRVVEIDKNISSSKRLTILKQVPSILTPAVVENLPPYFHGITSSEHAEKWLAIMLQDSRLLEVSLANNELVGFLFVSLENEALAHIGYLLTQEHWGKGLASELLNAFIEEATNNELWTKLIGGVDQSNVASANLLKKLGFVAQPAEDTSVVFYEYSVSR